MWKTLRNLPKNYRTFEFSEVIKKKKDQRAQATIISLNLKSCNLHEHQKFEIPRDKFGRCAGPVDGGL